MDYKLHLQAILHDLIIPQIKNAIYDFERKEGGGTSCVKWSIRMAFLKQNITELELPKLKDIHKDVSSKRSVRVDS